jgi:uracil phosphoribosyltransferase
VECEYGSDIFVLILNFSRDYSKLPPSPPVDLVFLLDPLIATGGTACAALTMIVDWGIPGRWLFYLKITARLSDNGSFSEAD